MVEILKINTNKFTKQGKVDIDGKIWSVVLPGAGTEMRFNQASRGCKVNNARIELLDKKIESDQATMADLDDYELYSKKYDENERIIYEIVMSVFKDDTADNTEVHKWLEETPTAIIMLAFQDVQSQAEDGKSNGPKDQTSSAG